MGDATIEILLIVLSVLVEGTRFSLLLMIIRMLMTWKEVPWLWGIILLIVRKMRMVVLLLTMTMTSPAAIVATKRSCRIIVVIPDNKILMMMMMIPLTYSSHSLR